MILHSLVPKYTETKLYKATACEETYINQPSHISTVDNMALLNRLYLVVMALVSVMSIASLANAATASAAVSSSLCNIITTVRTVVGIISLVLFILGGVMYAIAHMLPAAGNLRGNLQGWSLGMIVGGIVGLIIVIVAPGVISLIATSGGLTTATNCA